MEDVTLVSTACFRCRQVCFAALCVTVCVCVCVNEEGRKG
jgi:hypothetical protein